MTNVTPGGNTPAPGWAHWLDPRRSQGGRVGWFVVALTLAYAGAAAAGLGFLAQDRLLRQHCRQFALNAEEMAGFLDQTLRLQAGATGTGSLQQAYDDLMATYPEILRSRMAPQALVLDGQGRALAGPREFVEPRWAGRVLREVDYSDPPLPTPAGAEPAATDGGGPVDSFLGAALPSVRFEVLGDGREVVMARVAGRAGGALAGRGLHFALVEPAQRALDRAHSLWPQILAGSGALALVVAVLGLVISRQIAERDQLAALGAALEQRVQERTREVERLARESRYAAVVRERLRMARDLHDTLAHSMMAILAEVRLLRKMHVRDPSALGAELERAEHVAHAGLAEARASIAQLRINPVRDTGLGPALAELLQHFAERTGIAVDTDFDRGAAQFADEDAEAVFRIAEEALRNIERHARATRVQVSLGRLAQAQGDTLVIADDGAGFDPAGHFDGHYGLVGMREQAQLIGARLRVRSRPGEGTRIELDFALGQ